MLRRHVQSSRLQATQDGGTPRHRSTISRRSTTSRHSNEEATKANIEKLKSILRPEWEVDYLDELNDDVSEQAAPAINMLIQNLNSSDDDIQSLQEYRYLSSIRDDLIVNEELYSKFNNYNDIIKNSRIFLKPLFDYISSFEKSLNQLSREMEFLQNRSNTLNTEIQDKKAVDLKLTPLINDLIISPDVIKSILEEPINSNWQENIRFLIEKSEIFDKYLNSNVNLQSIAKLKDLIHLMELKAVERIRDYLILKIKSLRKSNVSSQVIQKSLLSVKEIFQFLKLKNETLANELKQAYIYTMRWYYYQNFVKYLFSLEKLKLKVPDKNIILGNLVDEEFRSSSYFFSSSGSSANTAASASKRNTSGTTPAIMSTVTINDYLTLNKRDQIISSPDQSVMLGQIAETNQKFHWIEEGFKNFNQALLDNVSTEYLFLSEFFQLNKFEEVNECFKSIFQPTFQLGIHYTKFLLEMSPFDSYGVLICIRLSQKMEYELQHRRIPVMEDYLNLQLINLWPKLQSLIDMNCESIKKILSYSNSIINSSSNMIPLPITQQFAMFLSGLLKLSVDSVYEIETSEPLTNSIIRLRNVLENVLTKLSNNISNEKKRELFLYNNYFLIATILSQIDNNQLAEDERVHFEKLADSYKN